MNDERNDRRRERPDGVPLSLSEVETEPFARFQAGVPNEGFEPARGSEIPEVASLEGAAQILLEEVPPRCFNEGSAILVLNTRW